MKTLFICFFSWRAQFNLILNFSKIYVYVNTRNNCMLKLKIMFYVNITYYVFQSDCIIIMFFCHQLKITHKNSQTKMVVSIWTTNDSCLLEFCARLSVLNYASRVYEWAMSCGNFLSGSRYRPNNLQSLVILLVLKPSLLIESTLLQMLH